ncbi:hypothetical protein YC2023_034891 [Brassica napus]
MGGAVKDIASKSELDNLGQSGAQVVLHFWALWCDASKQMDQVFSHLATDFPRAHFFRLQGMQSEAAVLGKPSLWREASRIISEEGFRAFWKGNLVTEAHRLPYSALNFYAYEKYNKIWVRSDLASTEEVGRASLPPLPFSVLACTRAALTGSSQGIFELLLSVSEKPAVSRLTTRRTSIISSIDDIHGVLTASSHSFSSRSCHWLLGLEDNPLRSDAYCKKMELSIFCCLNCF